MINKTRRQPVNIEKKYLQTISLCMCFYCCSVTHSCMTLGDTINCSMPGFPVVHHLPELTQTHVHYIWLVMPSNHLIFCGSRFLLPSIFPSIRVFSNESVFHIRWPKYWSFSFSINPFNKYSGLISFRINRLDLFAIKGILKSPLQHHNSKASILQHSASFMVQLSHPYMTTRKTRALTRWEINVSAF